MTDDGTMGGGMTDGGTMGGGMTDDGTMGGGMTDDGTMGGGMTELTAMMVRMLTRLHGSTTMAIMLYNMCMPHVVRCCHITLGYHGYPVDALSMSMKPHAGKVSGGAAAPKENTTESSAAASAEPVDDAPVRESASPAPAVKPPCTHCALPLMSPSPLPPSCTPHSPMAPLLPPVRLLCTAVSAFRPALAPTIVHKLSPQAPVVSDAAAKRADFVKKCFERLAASLMAPWHPPWHHGHMAT